jgi:hypothetical protein
MAPPQPTWKQDPKPEGAAASPEQKTGEPEKKTGEPEKSE